MHGFGLREGVGIGVLALALVIGFLFLDPSASESKSSYTPPAATGVPAEVTHTVVPPQAGWGIEFYEVLPGGGQVLSGNGTAKSLDMTYAGAPFPDFHDDQWFVRASTAVEVTDGLSKLTILHDGDLRVLVDDVEVAHDADGPVAKTFDATFRHAAGVARVTIEARDTGGPFRLKFGE